MRRKHIKMATLETLGIPKEELMKVFSALMNGEDHFTISKDAEGKPVTRKIVSKGNLYIGHNLYMRVNTYEDKSWLSINYTSLEDRKKIKEYQEKNK